MALLKLQNLTAEQVARILSVCPSVSMSVDVVKQLFKLAGTDEFDDYVREWQQVNHDNCCMEGQCPTPAVHAFYSVCVCWLDDATIRIVTEREAVFTVTRYYDREAGCRRYRVRVAFARRYDHLAREMRQAAYV